MKVGTLLVKLGKTSSLRAPVKVKETTGAERAIDRVYFRKDGTLVITLKGG